MKSYKPNVLSFIGVLFSVFFATFFVNNFAFADANKILQIESKSAQTAIKSQENAQELDEAGQIFFEEFRQLRHETLQVEAYNTRLQNWNKGLKEQIETLKEDNKSLEATRRSLIPLLEEMVARLGILIQDDLPFKIQQRQKSVQDLQQLLTKTNVSQAEKLRKILQTYRQELDYGKTLEAYNEEIELKDAKQMVKILRLGRIGLYYLSVNEDAGFFNVKTNSWEKLSSSARDEVKKAIEMAEKSGIPQLLHLPLSVEQTLATQNAQTQKVESNEKKGEGNVK